MNPAFNKYGFPSRWRRENGFEKGGTPRQFLRSKSEKPNAKFIAAGFVLTGYRRYEGEISGRRVVIRAVDNAWRVMWRLFVAPPNATEQSIVSVATGESSNFDERQKTVIESMRLTGGGWMAVSGGRYSHELVNGELVAKRIPDGWEVWWHPAALFPNDVDVSEFEKIITNVG